MIVSQENFVEVCEKILTKEKLAFDTETTGLRRFHGDRIFSIAVADDEESYYFNFKEYEGLDPKFVLTQAQLKGLCFGYIFGANKTIFGHNIKFDLHMVRAEGVDVSLGNLHDTMIAARLLRNNEMSYSLASCAKRIGREKDNAVDEYITKKKLYTVETIPGKKTRFKNKRYDLVPFELISQYAKTDARLAYELGCLQLSEMASFREATPGKIPGVDKVYKTEMDLIRVFLKMEEEGMTLNRQYVEDAITHEEKKIKEIKSNIEKEIGRDFVDSSKALREVFVGCKVKLTEKGNPSFDDESLSAIGTALSHAVLDFRDTQKRANTYFRNFKFHVTKNEKIHCDLRQSAAETGRISITDPPLQTLSKRADKGKEFPIRRSFIPEPGTFLLELDYKYMEFALMLDRAGEMPLIEKIKAGHDPHQATAEMAGVTRDEAKTLNFMLLYGGGAGKLSHALKIPLDDAKAMKWKYFQALPRVQRFMWSAIDTAILRGFVFNFAGRRFYFPDPRFAYKAPNAIIQGSGADICKLAMLECARILEGHKSKLVLQIHDALVFKMYPDEVHLIPLLKNAMESAYPYRHLPLSVDMKSSTKSWWDLEDGLPATEGRDIIHGQGEGVSKETRSLLLSENARVSEARGPGLFIVPQPLVYSDGS